MAPWSVGSMELVPRSQRPHPQAQARTFSGASSVASNPPVIMVNCELNFFIFINLVPGRAATTGTRRVTEISNSPRAQDGRQTRKIRRRVPVAGEWEEKGRWI